MKVNFFGQNAILVAVLFSIPAWAADPTAPGVPNFHQVNELIYRGGQPTEHGWSSLAGLGVKTVVDLRREDEHSARAERKAVEAAGMRYINVPMNGVVAPPDEKIAKTLALLESSSEGPVFVHCKRGADRTGTVIACYRIRHDHWDNPKALKEAKSFGMSWTQIGMKRYIESFRDAIPESASAAQPSQSVGKP